MNIGNSLWWVPLGAAAIALIGVVVGQLLAASVEGRRQRRETRQRTFEHWRDKRLEVYSEFFQLAHSWIESMSQVTRVWERKSLPGDDKDTGSDAYHAALQATFDSLVESLRETIQALPQKVSTVRLLASDSWSNMSLDISKEILAAHESIMTRPGGDPLPRDESDELIKAVWEKLYNLRHAARAELGILP